MNLATARVQLQYHDDDEHVSSMDHQEQHPQQSPASSSIDRTSTSNTSASPAVATQNQELLLRPSSRQSKPMQKKKSPSAATTTTTTNNAADVATILKNKDQEQDNLKNNSPGVVLPRRRLEAQPMVRSRRSIFDNGSVPAAFTSITSTTRKVVTADPELIQQQKRGQQPQPQTQPQTPNAQKKETVVIPRQAASFPDLKVAASTQQRRGHYFAQDVVNSRRSIFDNGSIPEAFKMINPRTTKNNTNPATTNTSTTNNIDLLIKQDKANSIGKCPPSLKRSTPLHTTTQTTRASPREAQKVEAAKLHQTWHGTTRTTISSTGDEDTTLQVGTRTMDDDIPRAMQQDDLNGRGQQGGAINAMCTTTNGDIMPISNRSRRQSPERTPPTRTKKSASFRRTNYRIRYGGPSSLLALKKKQNANKGNKGIGQGKEDGRFRAEERHSLLISPPKPYRSRSGIISLRALEDDDDSDEDDAAPTLPHREGSFLTEDVELSSEGTGGFGSSWDTSSSAGTQQHNSFENIREKNHHEDLRWNNGCNISHQRPDVWITPILSLNDRRHWKVKCVWDDAAGENTHDEQEEEHTVQPEELMDTIKMLLGVPDDRSAVTSDFSLTADESSSSRDAWHEQDNDSPPWYIKKVYDIDGELDGSEEELQLHSMEDMQKQVQVIVEQTCYHSSVQVDTKSATGARTGAGAFQGDDAVPKLPRRDNSSSEVHDTEEGAGFDMSIEEEEAKDLRTCEEKKGIALGLTDKAIQTVSQDGPAGTHPGVDATAALDSVTFNNKDGELVITQHRYNRSRHTDKKGGEDKGDELWWQEKSARKPKHAPPSTNQFLTKNKDKNNEVKNSYIESTAPVAETASEESNHKSLSWQNRPTHTVQGEPQAVRMWWET